MNKTLLLILGLVWMYSISFAQVDSLQNFFQNHSSKDTITQILSSSNFYLRDFSSEEGEQFLVEFRRWASYGGKDPQLWSIYCFHQGSFLFRRGDYDSSQYYLQQAITWGKTLPLNRILPSAYAVLGNMKGRQGDLAQKLLYLDSALTLANRLGNNIRIKATIQADRGSALWALGREKEFLAISRRLIKELTGEGLPYELSGVTNNLASYFIKNRQQDSTFLDSGIFYLTKALTVAEQGEDTRQTAVAQMNLGASLSLYPDHDRQQVDTYLQTAQASYQTVEDRYGEARVLYQMGITAYHRVQYRSAIVYCKQAATICERNDYVDMRVSIAELMYLSYQALGDFKQSLQYFKQYTVRNDSLRGAAVEKKIATLEASRKIDQKSQEIQLLRRDQRLQRSTQWILVLVSLLLLVILGAAWATYRTRRKLTQKEVALLRAKMVLQETKENNLKLELQEQSRTLVGNTLALHQRKQLLEGLLMSMDRDQSQSAEATLRKLRQKLVVESSDANLLEEFQTYFKSAHPDFIQKLAKDQRLTQREIRLLAFVKIGLGTKEMASLLGVQANSIKVSKYRLKKKLFPESDSSLEELVQQL